MAYFAALILVMLSMLVLITNQFKIDAGSLPKELDSLEKMVFLIDDGVASYVKKGKMENINFEELQTNNDLGANYTLSLSGNDAYINFTQSNIHWQLIPNPFNNKKSYKLRIDFHNEPLLMERVRLIELFIGKEICEKMLFGEYIFDTLSYDSITQDYLGGGTDSDGILSCTLYK